MSASQLAEVMHLERGTISLALAHLEHKRLITRSVDSRDRRRVALALSVKGKALAKPDSSKAEHVMQRLLARVGRADTQSVKAILAKLSHALLARVHTTNSAIRKTSRT